MARVYHWQYTQGQRPDGLKDASELMQQFFRLDRGGRYIRPLRAFELYVKSVCVPAPKPACFAESRPDILDLSFWSAVRSDSKWISVSEKYMRFLIAVLREQHHALVLADVVKRLGCVSERRANARVGGVMGPDSSLRGSAFCGTAPRRTTCTMPWS